MRIFWVSPPPPPFVVVVVVVAAAVVVVCLATKQHLNRILICFWLICFVMFVLAFSVWKDVGMQLSLTDRVKPIRNVHFLKPDLS